jgi:hypothetical protein
LLDPGENVGTEGRRDADVEPAVAVENLGCEPSSTRPFFIVTNTGTFVPSFDVANICRVS